MKKPLIAILVFLAMVGAVTAFSGTTTTDATTVSQGVCWSVNCTGSWGGVYNMTNGTVEVKSAKAGVDWTQLKAVDGFDTWSNGSDNAGGLTYNITVCQADLSTIIGEVNDAQLRIKVKNATSGDTTDNEVTCSATTANKVVDFVKPSCSLSGVIAQATYDPTKTTVTVIGNNASTSGILFVGTTPYTMTSSRSGSIWTYTFPLGSVPESSNDIYAITSDGRNETACTTIESVTLDKPNRGGAGALLALTAAEAQAAGQQVTIDGAQLTIGGKATGVGGIPFMVIGIVLVVIGALLIFGLGIVTPMAGVGWLLVIAGLVSMFIL